MTGAVRWRCEGGCSNAGWGCKWESAGNDRRRQQLDEVEEESLRTTRVRGGWGTNMAAAGWSTAGVLLRWHWIEPATGSRHSLPRVRYECMRRDLRPKPASLRHTSADGARPLGSTVSALSPPSSPAPIRARRASSHAARPSLSGRSQPECSARAAKWSTAVIIKNSGHPHGDG